MDSRTDDCATPKKGSLKKQLSFDEKVTEIHLETSDLDAGNKNNGIQENIGWWLPPHKNRFTCFCKSTSMHGLQYIGDEGMHIGERILWVVAFLISLVAALWLIKSVFIKYYDSPVVVTFQPSEMFVGDLPFAAVTICNMNRVLRSKANEYIRIAKGADKDEKVQKARQDVYYLDHVCSVSNKPFSKMFNYSMKRGTVDPELLTKVNLKKEDEEVVDVRRFLRKASQSCEQMIQLCIWEGDIRNCKELFRPIETNFGKCCVFNMLPHSLLHTFTNDSRDSKELLGSWSSWKDKLTAQNYFRSDDEQTPAPYPKRQNRAGKASGLMFLLDPALNEYFCTSSDSTGFKLSVHFSADVPHVTDFGLAIRPNYEHFVSVTPDVIKADDVIRSYAINKRNCYFEGEFPLKYYSVYSASNCLDECVANKTYEQCSCVRYYMPRDDSREICRPGNITCADDVKKSLFKSGVKQMCQQCLPTCTEIKYSASSTMAPLQRLDLWVDDESNKPAPWAKSNISIVHVYFGQDSTYPKVRGQMYGITDLIANTGGLLGLCMGFSMLSLVEVIYLCTIRHWCRRKHSKYSMFAAPQVPVANGCNGNSSNVFQNPVEARRVNMKPGDDGGYDLQIKNFCSAPLPTVIYKDDDTKADQNGKKADVVDSVEDSRL
ncbi:unnamed protein product [Orchesella dallaii]|uniref:Pickpocket protein 28 n=1 Tax=Orchesella dallaii TaxID=48710 RepID=A0ABP1QWF2_9HEXA